MLMLLHFRINMRLLRIRVMFSWEWKVTRSHVLMGCNIVVDALSRDATRDGLPFRIWRLPPSKVIALLYQDVLV